MGVLTGFRTLFGGAGDDTLNGLLPSVGVELHGRAGADTLTGSTSGNDMLFGEAGTDTLVCQTGSDRFNSTVDPVAGENAGNVCGDGATYNPNGTFTPLG